MVYVGISCQVLLGSVFFMAIIGKLHSRAAIAAFVDSIGQVHTLVPRLSWPTAIAVLITESLIVALLAFPATIRFGYLLAVVVLSLFSLVITIARRAGRNISCQCFGSDAGAMRASHLLRNCLLAFIAVLGLLTTAVAPSSHGPKAAEAVLFGGLALLIAIGIVRSSDLAYLMRSTPHQDSERLHPAGR